MSQSHTNLHFARSTIADRMTHHVCWRSSATMVGWKYFPWSCSLDYSSFPMAQTMTLQETFRPMSTWLECCLSKAHILLYSPPDCNDWDWLIALRRLRLERMEVDNVADNCRWSWPAKCCLDCDKNTARILHVLMVSIIKRAELANRPTPLNYRFFSFLMVPLID